MSDSQSTAIVPVDVPAELQTPSGMTRAVYSAIDAQRTAAVSYVRAVRRRQPDATPSEIITSLERHYVASVTASGTAVGATAFIPGAGTAIALGAGAAELLLQFELAALFGLAVAEVHGLSFTDRDRARAVVLTLMLGPEGRSKVLELATAAIRKDPSALGGAARQVTAPASISELPLADMLGFAVPADLMPAIVDSVQGIAKKQLPEKATVAATRLVPGGIGMLLGAVGGYAAGNEVVQAAKQAFGPAPAVLPESLEPVDTDGDAVPDPTVFEVGMRGAVGRFVEVSHTAGAGISAAASAVGTNVASVATTAAQQFQRVDLDGDGIADEPRALTNAKRAGSAIKGGATGAVGALGTRLKRKKDADGS